MKKLVAYSSVSHMGFVALGMFSMTTHGVNGAILQMLNHGVSTGALFILVGVIYERRHTRDLDQFGGLAKVMPWYAVAFIIVSMSSIGLPGTNGFVGEFLIMSGAFVSTRLIGFGQWSTIFTVVAALGVILAAVYMLHAILKMFWGPITHKENENLKDMTSREWIAIAPLMVLIFVTGLWPNMFLHKSQPAVEALISDFSDKWAESDNNDSLHLWHPDQHVPEAEAVEGAEEAEPAENEPAAAAPNDPGPDERTALVVSPTGSRWASGSTSLRCCFWSSAGSSS